MRELLVTNCEMRKGQRLHAGSAKTDPDIAVVYAYLYNSCLYESSYAVVSLHKTIAGAYKAKQKSQYALELEALQQNRRDDRSFSRECGFPLRKGDSWRRADRSVGHMIAQFQVHSD